MNSTLFNGLVGNHHSKELANAHIRTAINEYNLNIIKQDTLNKWRKKISHLSLPEFMPYDYLFHMDIAFPTGNFSYQFDLTDIIAFLKKENIQPIRLETNMMFNHMKYSWKQYEDDTPYPIIFLETPLLPNGFLLSGHKKILQAKEKKQKKIDVYVLGELDYLPLMYDDISKAMYMFHRDLQILISTPYNPSHNELFFYQSEQFL